MISWQIGNLMRKRLYIAFAILFQSAGQQIFSRKPPTVSLLIAMFSKGFGKYNISINKDVHDAFA